MNVPEIKSKVRELTDKHYPWIYENVTFLTYHGSKAYGTETESSDLDLYGFTIPPAKFINPFSVGYIPYFDDEYPKFNQVVECSDELDVQIYNVVKFFKLVMGGK